MKKKPLLCAVLAAGLLASLCVTPAFAAGEAWKEAYHDIIKQSVDRRGNTVQLVDLDLDGTPELIIGGMPGSGLFSNFMQAYTVENGELKTCSGDTNMCLGDKYELYRSNSTGAYRIEGPFTLRAGAGYHSTMTASYAIRNGELVNYVAFGTGQAGES